MLTYIVILMLAIMFAGESKAQTLVVWQKDGSKVSYCLDNEPITTFTLEELIIKTNIVTISYPLKNMLRYSYEGISQGIDDIKSQGVMIKHHGNEIVITGILKGKTIAVYSVDGKLIMSKCSDGTTPQALSLNQLPAGIYLIKVDNVKYKFTKQ